MYFTNLGSNKVVGTVSGIVIWISVARATGTNQEIFPVTTPNQLFA